MSKNQMRYSDKFLSKNKVVVQLKRTGKEIKVDEWLVSELKELDEAGVRVLLFVYNYEEHEKCILIDKESHDKAWEMGYVPMRFSMSGKVERMGIRFPV